MDVTNARIIMDDIATNYQSGEGREKVREGALASLDARCVMLDGLYRAVYGEPAPVVDAAVRAANPAS